MAWTVLPVICAHAEETHLNGAHHRKKQPMRPKLSKLALILAVNALLFATSRPATAYVIQVFGPPGPGGYGEFYQSNQSPAADPSCNCIDGGVAVFNGTDLETAYDAWVTAVFTSHGILPGDFFGEDFDGPGWTHNQVFDSQEPPGGAPVIADGVTISNDLPDGLAGPPDSLPLVPGRAEEPAKADHSPGSAPAIDKLAWEARDEFAEDDDEIPEATIDFSVNKTDFLGFYVFDASKQGTYNLQYTDGTIFSFIAAKTDNQEDDNGFYRFIGFINTHPTAQINRFWVTNGGSRYGIDEIEWGRGKHEVPEPGALWLLSAGGAIILTRSRRRFMA
jgi:hypothetical protein